MGIRASEAAVNECGKLDTLNIERSAGFSPRKDIALKVAVMGENGNV